MSVINGLALGARVGGVSGWHQVLTVEQGTTPADPSTVLASATWLGGTLTLVPANSATPQIDGRLEALPGISALVSDVFPGLDLSLPGARMQMLMAIDSMPATTAKWGLAMGVADTNIAGFATRNAALGVVFPNSGTVWNVGVLADAGLQTSVSQGSTAPAWLFVEVSYNPDTLQITIRGHVYNTAGIEQELTSFTGTADTAGSLAALRIMLAAVKVDGTVAGQPTLQARWWVRGIPGVPFP